jgi:hypothetical protein
MKRSTLILAGLLLAAGLASAAPGNTRAAPARRHGLLGWLFGRRPVVVVRHAPRRVVHRNRCEVRHDRGRHLGWAVGRHRGWYRYGGRNRQENRHGQGERGNEHRQGRGRGRQ